LPLGLSVGGLSLREMRTAGNEGIGLPVHN
jgi:hypothetical protein